MFRDLQYGELLTINAHMFQCATDMRCPDVVFNASPEVPPLYIWSRTFEVYEVANGFLFCHTKPLFTIVILSLTPVCRPVKVERLWMKAFRVLYGYLPLMDIVCLKMTSVLTHRLSWTRGLIMPTSLFQSSLLGLAQVGLRSLIGGLITRLAFLQGSTLGLGAPLCRCSLEVPASTKTEAKGVVLVKGPWYETPGSPGLPFDVNQSLVFPSWSEFSCSSRSAKLLIF